MAHIVYHIQDSDGEIFPVRIYVSIDQSNTVAFYQTNLLEAGWNLIMPLITGILIRADLVHTVVPEDVFPTWSNNVVDLLSDIQEKAKFTWAGTWQNTRFVLSLPTVREVIFTNSGAGKIVDITDSDVAAFLAFMLTSSADFTMVDSHQWDLTKLESAVQHFGKG